MSSTVKTLVLQNELVPLLRSGLSMKKAALEFNLRRYRRRLQRFEQQYGMDSATFAAQFEQGELGDEADWFEWEYNLEAYHQTQKQIQLKQ